MKIEFVFSIPKVWWKIPMSKLIRYVERTRGSHFAIIMHSISGSYVYESIFPHSIKSKLSDWELHNQIKCRFDWDVPNHLQYDVYAWLNSMMLKWYSVPQLFFILIVLIDPLDRFLKWSSLNKNSALICTELGSRFIEKFMNHDIRESHDRTGVADMVNYAIEINENSERWKSND